MRGKRNGRAFPARRFWAKRAGRNGIKQPEIVLLLKLLRFGEVDSRCRLARAEKGRSRNLPALQHRIRAVAAQCCFQREFPNVVRIEGMAEIILCRSVSAAQVVRVLRTQRVGAASKAKIPAVG